MGHEVITAGPPAGAYLPWANGRNLEPYEWKPDIAFTKVGGEWHYPSIDYRGVDLVIQMDAHFSLPERPPCKNVLWAIDNHVAEYGAYDTFDRIFIAHSWGHMHDLPNAEWLPCAHDPQQHYVIDETRPRPIDVLMLGNPYPERLALIQALRDAGINVQFGLGVIYDQYNAAYNQAKIALVKSSCGDVAMRVFENMAQGCLVVADAAADMERCGFEDIGHYHRYTDIRSCIDKLQGLLEMMKDAEPEWQIKYSLKASRAAVANHTWEARCKRILEAVGI